MSGQVSAEQELANRGALRDFLTYWRESPDYRAGNRGNTLVRMPVRAIYAVQGSRSVAFRTEMQIVLHAGATDGDVHLLDTEQVRIEDYHLAYKPTWQTYAFDKSSKGFVISGRTRATGALYSVEVQPTLEDPSFG